MGQTQEIEYGAKAKNTCGINRTTQMGQIGIQYWPKAKNTCGGKCWKHTRPNDVGRPSASPHHMVAAAPGGRPHVVIHQVIRPIHWLSLRSIEGAFAVQPQLARNPRNPLNQNSNIY